MNWYEQMSIELKNAGLNGNFQKVPEERRAGSKEAEKLNQRIKEKIKENDQVRLRSYCYNLRRLIWLITKDVKKWVLKKWL